MFSLVFAKRCFPTVLSLYSCRFVSAKVFSALFSLGNFSSDSNITLFYPGMFLFQN